MSETYRAVLNGDQLTWIDKPPSLITPVEVRISLPEVTRQVSLGPAMAAALDKLAKTGGLVHITDPVRWQREMRQDRELPDRQM